MTTKYFQVCWAWLDACGIESETAIVLPVKDVETNMIGGKGFDAFITLDLSETNGFIGERYIGQEWVVAACRGEFVNAPEVEPSQIALQVLFYSHEYQRTGEEYYKIKAWQYATALIAGGDYEGHWPNTWLAYHQNKGVK